MQTVTVDIIDENALKLLRDMELLKLIRLHKDESQIKNKIDWLAYKGAMTKQSRESVEKQLIELRSEWE